MFAITIVAMGASEISRILIYAPFFCVPLVVLFFTKLRNPLKNYAFIILAGVLVVLSFPTFLAHNNTVDSIAYYSYEFSAYQWLKEQYSNEQEFYYAGGSNPINYYFAPPSAQAVGTGLEFLNEQTIAGLLQEKLDSISTLEKMSQWYDSVYIFEPAKETAQFEHLLSYNPVNSPEWQEFLQQLTQQDRIYDNGYMQFYKVRTAQG